jgi:hypothetical protein
MATDYAEKEREFIAGLAGDTGRDLEGWMQAIAVSGIANRNDIIDWLRLQGFAFAKASWLERIHHNGGRLIYAGDVAAKGVTHDEAPKAPPTPTPTPILAPAPALSQALTPFGGDVATLLLAAKGLRPLADLVLRDIATAIPHVTFEARAPLIVMRAPFPFAALLPGAKQLKLYAAFDASGDARITTADAVHKAPPPFPAMIVLNDARSIDHTFRDLIAMAHASAVD